MAQGNGNGAPWKPNGNIGSTNDFLGTTNNFPLLIKTNNTTRFTFDNNGDIIFNTLANTTTNRILSIDAAGKLSALSGTSVASLLINNGIGVLEKAGNDYFLPSGNLGIGIAPSPGFKLDVIGDVRISNNLLVGGGIVITDKVQAATQIKGFDVKVDHDLNVTGSASFTGAATFKNALVAEQGLDLGSSFGIKAGATDASGNSYLQVGKSFGGAILPAPPICPSAASNMSWLSNYGGYISHATQGSMNASLSMWTDWINGNGHIEAQGTNNSGTANALLINYYCGRGVGINNGPNGGKIDLGGSATDFVTMFSPTKIRTFNGDALRIEDPNNNITSFSIGSNGKTVIGASGTSNNALTSSMLIVNGNASLISDNSLNSLEILGTNQKPIRRGISLDNDPNGCFNFYIHSWQSNSNFKFINGANDNNLMQIESTGKVYIGNQKVIGNQSDAKLQVDGKIASKSLYVLKPTNWADFVFKAKKSENLNEVENFISTYKHLPGIKSEKEILDEGYNINEIDALLLEKIERLYLHIIEQDKEIKKLKSKINSKL